MKPKKKVENQNLSKAKKSKLPPTQELRDLFLEAASSMEGLASDIRHRDAQGGAGGLVELDPNLPCLILPDLHARPAVLEALMETQAPFEEQDLDVRSGLEQGLLQVVMLGDGPHSEGRTGAERWQKAFQEYLHGWSKDEAMRLEMGLAFRAMELVARAIIDFPDRFFFLKGNHDNIMNKEGGGDHGFYKFAEEGAMAKDWTEKVMGPEFLCAYAGFERAFPLMARGGGFLACHAEPAFPMTEEEVINARERPLIIEGLTWTDNEASAPEAVEETLKAFLPEGSRPGLIFGGHRPVADRFKLRAGGRYVQIHEVGRMQAAWVLPGKPFDPISGIIDLGRPE